MKRVEMAEGEAQVRVAEVAAESLQSVVKASPFPL